MRSRVNARGPPNGSPSAAGPDRGSGSGDADALLQAAGTARSDTCPSKPAQADESNKHAGPRVLTGLRGRRSTRTGSMTFSEDRQPRAGARGLEHDTHAAWPAGPLPAIDDRSGGGAPMPAMILKQRDLPHPEGPTT